MKRLRDYPWNVQLGAVLAAIALIAGSVAVSAKAEARPYLSMAQGQKAIRTAVQVDRPSQVKLTCRRDSRIAVTCSVEEAEPHGSFTLEWEVEEASEAPGPVVTVFSATATLHGHHITIS